MKDVINTTRIDPETNKHYPGQLLAANDPRAWTNTLAFTGTPTQDQVNAHFDYLAREGFAAQDDQSQWYMTDGDAPVLYQFGIRWDATDDLQPIECAGLSLNDEDALYSQATQPEPAPMVKGEGAGQYTFDLQPNEQLAMF